MQSEHNIEASEKIHIPMQPHLAELLQHNDKPSAAVRAEVKDLMSKPLKELGNKDAEIQDLLCALKELEAERDGLDKTIEEYSPISSPIRRIPSEILQEIFHYCLPNHRNPVISLKEAPLLFTFICRSWRFIALSSPRIWARLHIPLLLYNDHSNHPVPYWQPQPPPDDPVKRHETKEQYRRSMLGRRQLVESWLSRSGTCPLSISLSFLGDAIYPLNTSTLDHENDLVRIFDSIFSVSSRLEDLELAMPFEMYQVLEPRISINSIAILRRLRLSFLSPLITPHPNPPKKQIMLLQAPTLRNLSTVTDSVHILDPQAIPSTWANLTHLSSHSAIANTDAIQLLRMCHSLEHCKLVISNDWPGVVEYDPGEILSLPYLRFLSLRFYGRDNMSGLYQRLDAPSLSWFDYQPYDHFSYSNANSGDDSFVAPTAPVRALIERSAILKKLSFDPQMLSSQDIVFCFRLASHLTHLILGQRPRHFASPFDYIPWTGNSASNFYLKSLIIEGDSTFGHVSGREILLPRLEVFEAYLKPNKFSDQAVKLFILGRLGHSAVQQGVSSLRSVKMIFGREMETDISAEIYQRAKEEGVEIELDLRYVESLPDDDHNNSLSPWYGLSEAPAHEVFHNS